MSSASPDRRRRAARLLACLALAGICSASIGGGSLLSYASSAAQGIGDILRGRSPGARDDNGLVMTKPSGLRDGLALAALRSAGAPLPAQESAAALPVPAAPGAIPPGPESLAGFPNAFPPFGSPAGLPAWGFNPGRPLLPGIGGGIGGGRDGAAVPPPDGTLPGPSSPVPEPATWLAMLAGMLILGGALRLRVRRRAAGSAALGEPRH